MTINKRLGKHTLIFNPISISAFASVVGPGEERTIGDYFQYTMEDNYDGKCLGKIRTKMMQHALEIALVKEVI